MADARPPGTLRGLVHEWLLATTNTVSCLRFDRRMFRCLFSSPVVYAAVELVPMRRLVYKYAHVAFIFLAHAPVVYFM